ncbi:hypothetical protein EVAR_38344_1 [Eumeta japonica]|uniref:Uncharacterized protein n=1 Tax=Eumeta variegata TaxID=151549 RepID=A0A4C1X7E2_EUMVA|nr:hypothetical protein EVAR_38344_1 [Eumeta japonica]
MTSSFTHACRRQAYPRENSKRSRNRSTQRKVVGRNGDHRNKTTGNWPSLAKNRDKWQSLEEAFTRREVQMACILD